MRKAVLICLGGKGRKKRKFIFLLNRFILGKVRPLKIYGTESLQVIPSKFVTLKIAIHTKENTSLQSRLFTSNTLIARLVGGIKQ